MEVPISPFSYSCPAYRLLRLWCGPCQERHWSPSFVGIQTFPNGPFSHDILAFEGFSAEICMIRNLTRSVHGNCHGSCLAFGISRGDALHLRRKLTTCGWDGPKKKARGSGKVSFSLSGRHHLDKQPPRDGFYEEMRRSTLVAYLDLAGTWQVQLCWFSGKPCGISGSLLASDLLHISKKMTSAHFIAYPGSAVRYDVSY